MPRITVAERIADALKDRTLDEILKSSEWDQHIVEQAVFHIGLDRDEFDCNQLRELLPEQGHGFLGAAINGMRMAGLIEHTGRMVPSTSGPTHGHRISVWRLTLKGHLIAKARRNEQQRAAA